MTSTPEQLGKYKIIRVVGKGAMGIVYEGFDPIIERTVAIKTIRTDELDPDEAKELARRFLIEAKAAGKLNHPNIVGIYDYGSEQSLAYIVMEFVQGKELKNLFDAGWHFNTNQIQSIMGQLLDALELAHENGVVHRDIKPANIFLTDNGTVKLGDFGIARIDSTHKTHAGTILGTPSYMSPEQIRGESVDHRTDLYSAGVILYQFLTGTKPFSGSMVAVMHKVLNEEALPPSQLNPEISPAFDLVVAKAMAKDLRARYSNAKQFSSDLRSAASEADDAEATRIIRLKDIDLGHRESTMTARIGVPQNDPTLAGSEIELEFWRSIKDAEDAANFNAYLRKYPQGHYAELAQLKLDKLRRSEPTFAAKADATTSLTGSTAIGDRHQEAAEAQALEVHRVMEAVESNKAIDSDAIAEAFKDIRATTTLSVENRSRIEPTPVKLGEAARAKLEVLAPAIPGEDLEATHQTPPSIPSATALPASPVKSNNARIVASALGGVVVVAIVGWLVLKPGSPPTPVTRPPAAAQPARFAPTAASASQPPADQAKAVGKEADFRHPQAESLAKSKPDQAEKEEARKLTDTATGDAAMKTAEERLAEAARKAAADAHKAAAKAKAEVAKAKAEAAKAAEKAKAEAAKAEAAKAEAAKAEAANKARSETKAETPAPSEDFIKAIKEYQRANIKEGSPAAP